MSAELIFSLVGGLGFFFFGMKTMSEGLKKIAGERLKAILHKVTKLPVIGLLIGALVTCLIQSSSATSVMVVGFVNAGLLTLKQAISVIMGANIGTTFTAWLISVMSVFKITHYALIFVAIGFVMNSFCRTKNAKLWGMVIMGFGMLFVGLGFMKDAFDPLKESQRLKELFITFSNNPLLGVLIGIIITMLLQSSSATIAIVQILAYGGFISFPAALPIVLGDNIGTTITAQLAAVGTNVTARRAAMSHTLFNVIGVIYMLFFVYTGLFVRFVDFIVPGTVTLNNVMFHIAVSHSVFNVVNALVFLPFIGTLERLCVMVIRKKKGAVEKAPQYLEKHLLETPSIAMEQAQREIVRMLGIASRSVSTAVKGIFDNIQSDVKLITELEDAVDNLQSEITQYLVEISQRNLTQEQSEELPVLIHSVNDVERIGDHSANIVELVERKVDNRFCFSDEAVKELALMWNELNSMMIETEVALRDNDLKAAQNVLAREKRVNQFQVDLKKSHVNRLSEGKCDLKRGIVFLDLIDNFEKIGDHLANIGEGVLGGMRWVFSDKHEGKNSLV